jgi:hypothetical protein
VATGKALQVDREVGGEERRNGGAKEQGEYSQPMGAALEGQIQKLLLIACPQVLGEADFLIVTLQFQPYLDREYGMDYEVKNVKMKDERWFSLHVQTGRRYRQMALHLPNLSHGF